MSLCKHPLAASHRPCMREGLMPFSLLPELDSIKANCTMQYVFSAAVCQACARPGLPDGMPFHLTGHNYRRTFATSYPSTADECR